MPATVAISDSSVQRCTSTPTCISKFLSKAMRRREVYIPAPADADRLILIISIVRGAPVWCTCHIEEDRHADDIRSPTGLWLSQEDQCTGHLITLLHRERRSKLRLILTTAFIPATIVSVFQIEAQGSTIIIDILGHLGR